MILEIDNYDSFVYNLAQYLGELGYEPVVYRNDSITLARIETMQPSLEKDVVHKLCPVHNGYYKNS